ncbi:MULTISPECIES: RNase P modulator RnpM [Aerococcus]|uniref:YlxR family protein n=2 Tax=Aerococcus TaxID=1375 RepID=A0A1E9PBS2_9LACT|nr:MULTISPECIES: YlxR family protein [Aerococcus]KAA9238813.1 YlxR family protein [Aerococcus urinae]KAA9292595.1 YlxR family protein [Aerococcus mictus]KAA9299487.1 YlxR family protein [Aerococcus tenax]MBU5610291.1 YlxR family protein [Aerococcus urinae]MCY3034345.1 YlxR family protein [Aerococcus mictus]
MKKRKIPMRRCVVSNEQFPKKELIRVVRTPEGEVAIDPSGKMNGRGAYVATDPDIVQKAWDKHLLDKHLEVSIDDAFYNELKDYADHMKARKELYGNE